MREIDLKLVAELQKRAVASARSAKSERRIILEKALGGTRKVSLAAAPIRIPANGDGSDFERHDESGAT